MRSGASLARRRLAAIRMHARRTRRFGRAGLILGLELALAGALARVIATEPGASAAGPARVESVTAVAATPTSFRRQPVVRVEGRITKRPGRVATRDRGAFVLAGDAGARLLVVPAAGARLQRFRIGTIVTVQGTVALLPDSRRLARRPATRTAVAKRAHASALIKATAVRYRGSSAAGT